MSGILFDAVSLNGRPSGTRSRLVRLVPELARRGHAVTVAHGPLLDAGAKSALQPAILREVSPLPGPGPARRLALQRLTYLRLLRDVSVEAVSAETFPMPEVPGLLALVHDLRFQNFRFPYGKFFDHLLRDACKRSRRIQTDTVAVAQELVHHLGIERDRIDVVPIAVLVPDLIELSPPELPEPYVLVVSHDDPHKDLSLAGTVAAGLADKSISVVRTGRPRAPAYQRASRRSQSLPVNDDANQPGVSIRHLGIVSDDRRDALLHHAVAVLVPSRLEGFGLVPLEALAVGASVVASDIPAHREVLGDAVKFFPPGDAKAALAKILEAAGASDLERSEQIAHGQARAAVFSPARAADAFEASLHNAGLVN